MREIIQRNMEGRTILFEVEHGYLSRSQNSKNDREPQNTLCLYLASSLLSLTTQITIKSQWKQYPIFLNSTRDKSSQRVRLTCTLSEVHRTFVIHKDLESVLICFIFRDMHLCISHLIRIKRYFVLR